MDRKRQKSNDQEMLDAAREWVAQAPPGIERVADLPIPQLQQQLPVSRTRRSRTLYVARAFAAAAVLAVVFGAGYVLGTRQPAQAVVGQTAEAPPARAPEEGAGVEPVVSERIESVDKPEEQEPSVAPPTTPPTQEQRAVATLGEPPRYARQENGKVLIETQLRGNGAHITWVVDGSFQLAQSRSAMAAHGDYQ